MDTSSITKSLKNYLEKHSKNHQDEDKSDLIIQNVKNIKKWAEYYEELMKKQKIESDIKNIIFPKFYKNIWTELLTKWLSIIHVLNVKEYITPCSSYDCRECHNQFYIELSMCIKHPNIILSGKASSSNGREVGTYSIEWIFESKTSKKNLQFGRNIQIKF